MKKERLQLVKYFGGMALCVILSVLILVFGEHDTDDIVALLTRSVLQRTF